MISLKIEENSSKTNFCLHLFFVFRNVGAMQGMTSWGQGMTGGAAAAAATQQMTGATAAQNAAAAAAAAIQQPTAAAAAGMMAAAAYPMQQFQV